MRHRLLFAIAMFVGTPLLPVSAQTIIDTRKGPVDKIWEYGGDKIAGQVFLAPTSNIMETGSLWLGANGMGLFTVILQQYSYGQEERFVGPRLWESETQTVTGYAPTRFEFGLGGISLTPGTLYAFFAYAPLAGVTGWTTSLDEKPACCFAIFGNSLDTPSAYGLDQAFVGTFDNATAAPEPASLWLLATGLMGVAVAARRRRIACLRRN